ncbi:MAG: hypothetical protein JRJ72_08425 [Deltaproteobacteria bacterium]|nr:hypothetical protein [Deltaproteobacteria bacterium]
MNDAVAEAKAGGPGLLRACFPLDLELDFLGVALAFVFDVVDGSGVGKMD